MCYVNCTTSDIWILFGASTSQILLSDAVWQATVLKLFTCM